MRRVAVFVSIAVMACVLWAQARAEEPKRYDLRRLVEEPDVVGDAWREETRERLVQRTTATAGGRVVESTEEVSGVDFTRDQRVVALDESGAPSRLSMTYHRFEVLEPAEQVEVAGLVVDCTRRGEAWDLTAGGGRAIPAAVHEHLLADLTAATHAQTLALCRALFPAAPKAVGESWDVDVSALTRALDFGEGLVRARSRGRGTLRAASVRDGKEWLKVEHAITLALDAVGGERLQEPMQMQLAFSFELSESERNTSSASCAIETRTLLAVEEGVRTELTTRQESTSRMTGLPR